MLLSNLGTTHTERMWVPQVCRKLYVHTNAVFAVLMSVWFTHLKGQLQFLRNQDLGGHEGIGPGL